MFGGNHHIVPMHRYHEEGVMVLHQRERTALQPSCPKAGVEVTVRKQETVMALKPQPFLNEPLRPIKLISLDFTQFVGINGG